MFADLLNHNSVIAQNIQLNLKGELIILIKSVLNELLLYRTFELRNKEILLHLLCELSRITTLNFGQKVEELERLNDLLLDLLKSLEKNYVSLFYLSTAFGFINKGKKVNKKYIDIIQYLYDFNKGKSGINIKKRDLAISSWGCLLNGEELLKLK
jgi:hypothetical protein